MTSIWQQSIKEFISTERLLINEPMSKHTTMQVGGPVSILVLPTSATEISQLIKLCNEDKIPYYIIGRGSNLIVRDAGFNGLIIKISDKMEGISIEGNIVKAKAGNSLASITKACAEAGLTGLEFASGIPGSLGGGLVMNAGAYGHDLGDYLTGVEYVDEQGKVYWEKKKN